VVRLAVFFDGDYVTTFSGDGVIVATPGYHGSLSGLIKNALEFEEHTPGAQAGQDPLVSEFVSTYGGSTSAPPPVYGMHWLLDVDNFYKYGNHGDGTSHVAYINTFQRGSQQPAAVVRRGQARPRAAHARVHVRGAFAAEVREE